MKFRLLVAVLFFVIPGLSYLSADIYRWTDSKGNETYGNLPPSDARNLKLMFKELPSASEAQTEAQEEDQRPMEAIIQELDEEMQREEQSRQAARAAQQSAPPSRSDMIAQEKTKLEKKIQDLEALPLDYFGSQKNKRTRIGYYQYRLETLTTNPNEYFSTPEAFEGNIKTPAKPE
jgi:hypothetical protein